MISGEAGQFNGRGQELADVFQYRFAGLDRDAKIALQEVAEIGQVLFVRRFVQSPFGAKGRNDLFVVKSILWNVGGDGVRGDGIGDYKGHKCYANEQRDGQQQTTQEKDLKRHGVPWSCLRVMAEPRAPPSLVAARRITSLRG